jgi:hypothetical protein
MSKQKNILSILEVLMKDIENDKDDGFIYFRSMNKQLTFQSNSLEIRFIDMTCDGFHCLNISAKSQELVARGLEAFNKNYSIDFKYFMQVIETLSSILTGCAVIDNPLDPITLTTLNWKDGHIQKINDNYKYFYAFNMYGIKTAFNDTDIKYKIKPSFKYSQSELISNIGYFQNKNNSDMNAFVIRMSCHLNDVNYGFCISLDASNPFIIMESGLVVTLDQFKQYTFQHFYKFLYREFSSTGVETVSLTELKKMSSCQIHDLIKLHEMVTI